MYFRFHRSVAGGLNELIIPVLVGKGSHSPMTFESLKKWSIGLPVKYMDSKW